MKRISKITMICLLLLGMLAVPVSAVLADDGDGNSGSINEKLGVPIAVFGETLTDEQKEETRQMLRISGSDAVEEFTVTGQDVSTYINGNPNARLFSSAKITREESGKGLNINIVTPENITEVTSEMYANALLTAGVEDATVDVASPVKVSGHSALTGIYKAYDVTGVELDKERMELANEELDVATDLSKKEGLSQEKVSELLTEIKKAIAEQKPATKEDVEKIIEEQLNKLEISLSEADRQMLTNLFEKMRDLDIDFGKVKDQLEDLTTTIKDKMDELGLDAGFWEKVQNFFKELFQKLADLFK
ncbi:DUF1002 domain-containing protein [Ornithinibacillus gellani]|uniref:DUF1002 domain-containing protein n=1 Tax=Ornithinibacillus gellani TaxID=2293253 RepID=UPI000F49335B|nr:DUF1002 domain-containing protein [Ornithinibacillus gellani]TQS72052.1 DUF1002 domain-containing protein [Ornithinibacillus gellani]